MYRILGALVASAAISIAMAAWSAERLSTSNDPTMDLPQGGGLTIEQLFEKDRVAILAQLPEALRKGLREVWAEAADPKLMYSEKWLSKQPAATGGPEFKCLAEALYFEARGESLKGQVAVAEVILNRRDSQLFPPTVCKVVHQGTGRIHECQFSYNCDGKPESIDERKAYNEVAKIARLMLDGAPRALTKGALYYHNKRVNPRWARRFAMTTEIGSHQFYKR